MVGIENYRLSLWLLQVYKHIYRFISIYKPISKKISQNQYHSRSMKNSKRRKFLTLPIGGGMDTRILLRRW